MARNGSGTYTVPNTFTAGTTITASSHNQNWTDVGSEITNSVAADGQTSMTGPLKFSAGTLLLPSQTFASDTNTGRYRKAADTMADVCGGVEIVEISATGIDVTGTVDATNIKQNGFSILPVGLGPIPWSGLTAPSGWVLCNGQLLSRTTYADLWAFAQTEIAAGNTLYGVGDSSTTFSVPDMRGRVPAGKDADIGGFALRLTTTYFGAAGTTLGAVGQSSERTTLVTGNLPPYTPSGTLSGTGTSAETNVQRDTSSITVATGGPNTIPLTNTGTVTINGNQYTFTGVAQGGTSTPIRTVQPTIITNYIIFAGV